MNWILVAYKEVIINAKGTITNNGTLICQTRVTENNDPSKNPSDTTNGLLGKISVDAGKSGIFRIMDGNMKVGQYTVTATESEKAWAGTTQDGRNYTPVAGSGAGTIIWDNTEATIEVAAGVTSNFRLAESENGVEDFKDIFKTLGIGGNATNAGKSGNKEAKLKDCQSVRFDGLTSTNYYVVVFKYNEVLYTDNVDVTGGTGFGFVQACDYGGGIEKCKKTSSDESLCILSYWGWRR